MSRAGVIDDKDLRSPVPAKKKSHCPLANSFCLLVSTLRSNRATSETMSDDSSNAVVTPVSPVTPKMSGLALTEYTAAPTPPSERANQTPGLPPNWGIPEAFLLPNGYPDVR